MVKFMLHILLSSPYKIVMNSLLSLSSSSDELVCIQDGVVLGIKKNIFFKKIYNFFNVIYLLKEDVYARGLCDLISISNKLINYKNFVLLTAKHKKSMTW